MQHKRHRELIDKGNLQLNNPICAGYLNIPYFVSQYFSGQLEAIEDTAHSLFEDLTDQRMQEYRVDGVYADERYPSIVEDLYVKQVPFLYQFDVDQDYTNTVGWIPGLNNNELFFISGFDAIKEINSSHLLNSQVDEAVLTNHLNKLQARLNLLKDLDKLDDDWI